MKIAAEELKRYPPLARQLVLDHAGTIEGLPQVFAALLLREAIGYDWQFPAERSALLGQLTALEHADKEPMAGTMRRFAALPLSPELQAFPWVGEPERFVEKLTAYLWTVHATDEFRAAALEYGGQTGTLGVQGEAGVPRLCIVLLGRGAASGQVKLFSKLRSRGTYFTHVDTAHGVSQALEATGARMAEDPAAYRHWYVDGGSGETVPAGFAAVSYDGLLPMRNALLERIHTARVSGTVGPEDLRSLLADMRPEQFGMGVAGTDPVLRHFELQVLTEGSGTQIFSTTFVQWTAREVLRRARPQTLLLRYGQRQVERPMNDLLLASASADLDPRGSLIDADMGAYYTWINLQRLPGAETTRFVACFEGGSEAIAIAPGIAAGVSSSQACDLKQILKWMA